MANSEVIKRYEVGDAVMTPAGVGVITGQIDRNGVVGLVVSIALIFTPAQVAPFGVQLRQAAWVAQAEEVESMPGLERAMESTRPLQGSEAL